MFIPTMEPLPYCPVKILRSAGGSLVYGSASHCANAGLSSVVKKSGFATVGNLPPTSVGVHRGRIKLSKMSLNMGDKRLLREQTASMLECYRYHNDNAINNVGLPLTVCREQIQDVASSHHGYQFTFFIVLSIKLVTISKS